MPLVPELWLLSERAKMKEFTTFAVARSFLPELHFLYMGPEAYSEHFSDKFRHEEHPERVAEKSRKKLKEWREVTFMEERV